MLFYRHYWLFVEEQFIYPYLYIGGLAKFGLKQIDCGKNGFGPVQKSLNRHLPKNN
jgi:hypothetical protein